MNKQERLRQDDIVDEPILFYRPNASHGCFSNFSDHEIYLVDPWTGKLRKYATGEHRFQAMKAINRKDHGFVCKAYSCSDAKKRGRIIELRDDWGSCYGSISWFVMLEICIAKAMRHNDVMDELQETKARHIYEDSPVDPIWGWRYANNYNGANLLGRAWMEARSIIFADGR